MLGSKQLDPTSVATEVVDSILRIGGTHEKPTAFRHCRQRRDGDTKKWCKGPKSYGSNPLALSSNSLSNLVPVQLPFDSCDSS